uniref:Myosin light chain 2 n=7 Tax=cellular organisms TaxID=131567 RepID=A0A8I5Y6I0_RAT
MWHMLIPHTQNHHQSHLLILSCQRNIFFQSGIDAGTIPSCNRLLHLQCRRQDLKLHLLISGWPLDFPEEFESPKKAKKRLEGGSSNVFSMFEQTQIQEFKEAFTIMDQNRDGFIDKNDLRDTFAALGRVNVKNEEIDEMIKEAPGPINFTVFLTMFGEKLKGADPEETILNAFKVFDPEGKGSLKADYVREMLTTQAERFSKEEIDQMFAAFPPDVTGNLDYKNLVHIITHGEEKD